MNTGTIEFARPNWPALTPRCDSPKRSLFGETKEYGKGELTLGTACERLVEQVKRYRASGILCGDFDLGKFRSPRSKWTPKDQGVCLYLETPNGQYTLPCDKWSRQADNINAIASHLNAVRQIERMGVASIEQLLLGFAALPEPSHQEWWEVLGVDPNATFKEAKTAYRQKMFDVHPDRGGSQEDAARVNKAYQDYQSQLTSTKGSR